MNFHEFVMKERRREQRRKHEGNHEGKHEGSRDIGDHFQPRKTKVVDVCCNDPMHIKYANYKNKESMEKFRKGEIKCPILISTE